MGDTSDICHGVLNACLWYAIRCQCFLYLMIMLWRDKEKLKLLIELKGKIERDPTYLVIILFINYPYHKVTFPIY